jgi:AcrR family transcriptional regulator
MTVKRSTSRSPRRASRRAKPQQRQGILDAAERLCGERGLEAVSVREIAAAAKVNLAAINYYFGSRQNLLLSIFQTRVAEVDAERDAMLAPLLAHQRPPLRDILRAMLTPLARWRSAASPRRAALQFLCRALTSAELNLQEAVGAGVLKFPPIIPLLQRALPHLSFEELCWRFHFMMSIEHMNPWDADRLELLSGGRCNARDLHESVERAIDFVEAGFLAPARFPISTSRTRS